ncbi:hypothetical protein DFH01_22845 [Falsiroseomonas bella]|uniref:Lipoprotein n=1 Tax=Falsiroseomonas bella TaxID=2184016 RepID=A0A317F7N1_9PROT|nr:hypothetical protein [Falsiroseomonas bella]PWS35150.1 hypothetical protein DFH01_22845 [Falsiroseomonas bella]
MRQGALAIAAVAMLAGCAQQGPAGPGATLGTAPPGFACPPAGTNVVRSDGGNITYSGAVPGDPFACAGSLNGAPQNWLANYYPVPTTDEASLRRGMAALWPLEPGKSVNFSRQIGSPDGQLLFVNTTWHVLGPSTLDVGDRSIPVLVLEQHENVPRMGGYAGVWTLYYDPASRNFVGGDHRVLRGFSNARNWRVTSLTVPGS